MKKLIIDSPLMDSINYKYSDLPFYIFKDYFERINQKSLDTQVSNKIYNPLGLKRTLYNPRKSIPFMKLFLLRKTYITDIIL